jgi:hypothetical protein
MPAKSKSQQKVFGMALAAKRGDVPVESLRGAAKHLYKTMTEAQLAEYAQTERARLPRKLGGSPKRKRHVRSY